jgi:uncharacterized protein YdeI (YjbR/CyaY-like superfamily)
MATSENDLPENATHPNTRSQWRTWLSKNHTRKEGVWLVLWKQASGKVQMGYDESVEEALCFGWIDSKPRKLDEFRSMLWFAPRKAKTGWSRPNKIRIERAISEGIMTSAGLAKIEAAKKDGSWSSLDQVEELQIPEDLAAEFKKHPPSADNFEAFPRSVKRGILEWILNAKRPETRATRILETATLAAKNERANQWKKK